MAADDKGVTPIRQAADAPYSADSLRDMEFPDLRWAIPSLIVEGCTILASRPKIGKSWMTLDLALSYSAFLDHFKSHGRPDIEAVIASAGEVTFESFDAVSDAVACMNHVESGSLGEEPYILPETEARLKEAAERFNIRTDVGELAGALLDMATEEMLQAAAETVISRQHRCAECLSHFDRMDAHISAARVPVAT